MIPPLGFRLSNLLRRSLRRTPPRLLLNPVRSISAAGERLRQSTGAEGKYSHSNHSIDDGNNYSYRDRDRRKMYNNSSTGRRKGPFGERGSFASDELRNGENFGGNYGRNQSSRKPRMQEGDGYGEIDGKGFGPRRGDRGGRDHLPFDEFRSKDKIGENDKGNESSREQRLQEGDKPRNGVNGKGFGRGDSFPFDEHRGEDKIGGSNKRNQASQEQRMLEGNSFLEKFKLGFDKDEKKPEVNPKQEEMQKEVEEGPPQEAEAIFKKMKETGLIPNAVAMLDGLCKDGLVQEAMKLFGLMREKGTIPEVVIYTAVVDGFCKAQKFDDAVRIFRKMQSNGIVPNAFSYTVLVQGLCKGKRLDDALEICLEMLENGHSPNLVTFVGLVDGFCQEKGLEEGKAVISTLRGKGFFCDEKGVRQYLDKKGPSVPLVWEALFGKSSSQASF